MALSYNTRGTALVILSILARIHLHWAKEGAIQMQKNGRGNEYSKLHYYVLEELFGEEELLVLHSVDLFLGESWGVPKILIWGLVVIQSSY